MAKLTLFGLTDLVLLCFDDLKYTFEAELFCTDEKIMKIYVELWEASRIFCSMDILETKQSIYWLDLIKRDG